MVKNKLITTLLNTLGILLSLAFAFFVIYITA
jgi:hypothetical protein